MDRVLPRPRGLKFAPLTPDRWNDFATLFGERGACGGCWCMWWRLPRSRFIQGKGEGNKRAMRRIVRAGPAPGILAYNGETPVGWCCLAPRESFPVLGRSRILAPVDSKTVWSIVCFFVQRPYRKRGMSVALLKAAVAYAREQGVGILEGYPVEPRTASAADAFIYTGTAAAFRKAGFHEAARRSPTRPIMRRSFRQRRIEADRLPKARR